jgi:hypothetical protein
MHCDFLCSQAYVQVLHLMALQMSSTACSKYGCCASITTHAELMCPCAAWCNQDLLSLQPLALLTRAALAMQEVWDQTVGLEQGYMQ